MPRSKPLTSGEPRHRPQPLDREERARAAAGERRDPPEARMREQLAHACPLRARGPAPRPASPCRERATRSRRRRRTSRSARTTNSVRQCTWRSANSVGVAAIERARAAGGHHPARRPTPAAPAGPTRQIALSGAIRQHGDAGADQRAGDGETRSCFPRTQSRARPLRRPPAANGSTRRGPKRSSSTPAGKLHGGERDEIRAA